MHGDRLYALSQKRMALHVSAWIIGLHLCHKVDLLEIMYVSGKREERDP